MQTEKTKGVVDIVFLVDITGSMQHCIDALKANISAFIDSLTAAAEHTMPAPHRGAVVWSLGVVGSRRPDHGDQRGTLLRVEMR